MTMHSLLDRHRRRARAGRRHVAALDPRGGRRRRGLRRRPRRDRQRHPGAAVDLRTPSGSTAATASPGASSSAPTARPGRWLGAHAIDAVRPRRPADRARLRRPRPAPASPSSRPGTRWACARRRATTRCSTSCSCPTPASGGSCPPVTAATCSSWPWRCGRCRSSPPSTSASPSGRSSWPSRRPPQDVDRHRAGAYAYNPMVQHQIAEMYLELDAAQATVDRFVDDWVAGVDHGDAVGAARCIR